MSKALYRKYRSKRLDEIVGQKQVTDILARSLAAGRISHAYLLTGPRGVGKTSIARILAHEINHLPYDEDTTHLDIIEIDAASNNGVEDVRDLREKVQIAPVSAHKKIYIIDEVHMLSKAAFNALLKTLEEPPEHAVFILATTDADKLPPTIISRTQRFHFRSIGKQDAIAHLRSIAKQENIKIDDAALELIALRGEGSFRDSISLLDQLQDIADPATGITGELVANALGLAPLEHITQLLEAYDQKNLPAIVRLLDEAEQSGAQTSALVSQLIVAAREQLVEKPHYIPLLDHLLDVTKSSKPALKLLTVLAAHTSEKPRTVALNAPTASISAPVAALKKAPPVKKTTVDAPVKPLPAPAVAKPSETKKPIATNTGAPINLDWTEFVEYTRAHYVAIYSVLSKCGYEIDGATLTIYTHNAFYKKKLDDSKYRINLMDALSAVGCPDAIIETIGTPPPPKDSTAAAVAAIMGGGEEVNVNEVATAS